MNSKAISFLAGLSLLSGIVAAQSKPFSIKGDIKGKSDGFVYLRYGAKGSDSARIVNGKFSFNGELNGPVQAMLTADKNPRAMDKYAQVYLMPGKMTLTLDYNNFAEGAVLKGSAVQAEADKLKQSKAAATAKIKPLSEAYSKANTVYIDAIKAKKDEATLEALKEEANKAKDAMQPYQEQLGKKDIEFMDQYPASYVTASLLRYRISGMPLQEGEERYSKIPEEIKNSSLGKDIKTELDGLRMGSPGAKAYVFASKELRGDQLSLANYKGKYVLVDFWASWCVPCRKGNPHLLSLYSKYKDKGFEIIGVSDDDTKPEAWKQAVEKDGIGVWKHVLRGLKRTPDGGFDRSESIADQYGIHSLPTKILIDPNGVIIGRYGGGGDNDEAMDKKFSELFGS